MKEFFPLRFQKIIMWIPYVNIFVLFCWLYNCTKTEQPVKLFLKSLPLILGIGILFAILNAIVSGIAGKDSITALIAYYLTAYFCPIAIAAFVIHFQNRYIF